MRSVATLLFVLALALPARAQEAGAAPDTASTESSTATARGDSPILPGAIVFAAEVGGIFPQPFTQLDTHVAVGAELGYRLPFVGQRIEIMAAVGYSPPENSFTEKRDEGEYQGTARTKQLHLSLGPRVRIMDRSSIWNVNLAVGPRLYMVETTSNGARGGQQFAEFTEKSTQVGVFVALGPEIVLGPGAIFIDVDFGWARLPQTITGNTSTGNLTGTLGYRLFLL